ncbi:MAG: TlpA family protein disulfide reductase, partial [Cytophagales bacterium]
MSLSSLKGKVVVLNFWGTHCKPCIKEMPELNDLKKRFSYNPDVVFLAPTRDKAAKLAGFFKDKQFDYQISYEADSIFETYKAYFVPVNMVINRQG